MIRIATFVVFACLTCLGAIASEAADRAARIEACEAVPAGQGQTGLLFNGAGRQTYYERSVCFLDLARKLRDETLCERVRERFSFFLDGSAYSEPACREEVREQVARDRMDAQRYVGALHDITRADFFRNGNGRDYDLVLETRGERGQSHRLTLTLFDGDERIGTLYENGYYMDADQQLLVYLPVADIRSFLGERPLDRDYRVDVAISLVPEPYVLRHLDGVPLSTSLQQVVNFARVRTFTPHSELGR